ncbi:hypothetical protein F2Q70_00017514 [Brassica cretica]|uniref:Uncharacterized protein n=1 Tax=Brassica cretica TaxID=69181 RepID=A0A8S9HU60_BRACR|nr:hypothetical protein F2Q70_00017514 [Brassica cretica]
MTRPFPEAWSLLPESVLAGLEISVWTIEVGLGRQWPVFLRSDSRLELQFGLVARIDRGLVITLGLRFRLEGFVAYGSFQSSHRCPLVPQHPALVMSATVPRSQQSFRDLRIFEVSVLSSSARCRL